MPVFLIILIPILHSTSSFISGILECLLVFYDIKWHPIGVLWNTYIDFFRNLNTGPIPQRKSYHVVIHHRYTFLCNFKDSAIYMFSGLPYIWTHYHSALIILLPWSFCILNHPADVYCDKFVLGTQQWALSSHRALPASVHLLPSIGLCLSFVLHRKVHSSPCSHGQYSLVPQRFATTLKY